LDSHLLWLFVFFLITQMPPLIILALPIFLYRFVWPTLKRKMAAPSSSRRVLAAVARDSPKTVNPGGNEHTGRLSANLARWRQSGYPARWIEMQRGQWDHAAWLRLLDDLRRSEYWPMDADSVGAVLEETRRRQKDAKPRT
jgi:hypothetical protein